MGRFVKKNTLAQWSIDDMQGAVLAVKNGSSVNGAAKSYNVPRKTLADYVKRGDNVVYKQLGRKPTLTSDQESELVERIIRMQQVGFGLTRAQVCKVVYRFVTLLEIPNRFKHEVGGRRWFEGFIRRHPEISVRTPEPLSYGRMMRFNPQTVANYFQLLEKTLDEMGLRNKPEMVYNVDESGLQLSYSKPDKILSEKGVKRVHAATNAEKGQTVTVTGCANATGSIWIPPYILYKGKNRKTEFEDGLPPGSEYAMTPKGYMTTEQFTEWLNFFQRHRLPGKCLLILDGHVSHMDEATFATAEANNITLLVLPAHCSHELQPMDKGVFKSLKDHWTDSLDAYRRKFPGRPISNAAFPQIFTSAWLLSATVKNAVSSFKATGVYPFDPQVIPVKAFAPSTISERPLDPAPNPPTPPQSTSSPVSSTKTFSDLIPTPKITRAAPNPRRTRNAAAVIVRRELFDKSLPSTSGVVATKKRKKVIDSNVCDVCGGNYKDDAGKTRDWVNCITLECKVWFHEDCANGFCRTCEANNADSD